MKNSHNPDYSKNKTVDVILKGFGPVMPQNHYQHNHNLTPAGSDNPGMVFMPRSGKDRPTPHKKTNECDH